MDVSIINLYENYQYVGACAPDQSESMLIVVWKE